MGKSHFEIFSLWLIQTGTLTQGVLERNDHTELKQTATSTNTSNPYQQ